MPRKKSVSKVVVNGKKVNKNSTTGWRKLFNMRYSNQVVVALLFVIIGVGGYLWASAATQSYSFWSNSTVPKTLADTDPKSVEIGTKFSSKYAGKVTAVKFYKSAQNTGTHTGSLWDSNGKLLAQITFQKETSTGWQTATFAKPVDIAANTIYVVSYHAPKGHYSANNDYFTNPFVSGPLTAPKDAGVYTYSSNITYPSSTYHASNYWVDVVVNTNLITPPVTPAPPTVVNAAQSGSSVVVSWNPGTSSTGIAKYRIYKDGKYLLAVIGSQLSYTDTAVKPGETHTYQVRTVDPNNVASPLSLAVAKVTLSGGTTNSTCPTGQTGTPPNCVSPPPPPPVTGSACGAFPSVPDANCTGWQHTGVTLTAYTGPSVITANGTVIDGKDINTCLQINASNVIIKRSRIRCQGSSPQDGGAMIIQTTNAYQDPSITGFTMEDVEVSRPDGGTNSANYGLLIYGKNTTLTRVNFHNMTSGVHISSDGVVIQDSYFHDMVNISGEDHNDDIISNGGAANVQIIHNNLEVPITQTTPIAIYPEAYAGGANSTWTIKNNLMNGGGFCIYPSYTKGDGPPNDHIVVTNNLFGNKFFANCGQYGAANPGSNGAAFLDGPGNSWSGNTWYAPGTAKHGTTVNP